MMDGMVGRDRDEDGRPRSARPRDALGRPLPRGATGVPPIADDLELPPAATLARAQDLLDAGLAFGAHEVLESAWKHGPAEERELWQGLAQLAVGITHVQRGNTTGAVSLLGSASARLAAAPARHGVDVTGLAGFADALATDVATGAHIGSQRLQPALLAAEH